ncbi:uncharacterized protein LOC113777055 [Coffea eugenioides]|uniref:uncharacterized protein LOC113777055 n=1 Tax=Coffea eugenioides TaxID=49369 RepID=UPI000F60C667|nr:uncharacterized protein LOC113777055 [Coffea eugenioides]
MKELRDSNVSGKGVKLALLKKKLVAAYKDEEAYWSQKARQKWLMEGDKNTKCVAGRRKRNRIGLLKKRDGDWCKDEEETGTKIIQYFKDIFTAEAPHGIDAILNEIPQSITSVMNKQLILPVTEQEVQRVVFSMHPNKSPSPDVNVNGEKKGIKPSRGLRQGDPLSPFLFLICAKGFSTLLNQAVRQGKLTDLQLSSGGPRLSHIFFADDSLIFCKAKEEEAVQLMKVLRQYGEASGQLINTEKSSIFFSKNDPVGERLKMLERVRVMKELKQSRYLGLPLVIGRSKTQVFNFVKEKVVSRISCWKERLLSMAGKEVPLKSVVMALPAYVMSYCKLSKELCRGIRREMAKFWWGSKGEESKMHWLGWGKLSEVKQNGGLGFRDLENFNLALLAKQLWRILTRPNLLVSKILKAKYFKGTSIWKMKGKRTDSWCWKSILSARSLLEEGMRKRVRDGKTIDIWKDRWIPGVAGGKELEWVFAKEDRERILQIPLSLQDIKDGLFWAHSASREYTVKSRYRSAQERKIWRRVRDSHEESGSRNEGILPVNENIKTRSMQGNPLCKCCGVFSESTEHMLFLCSHAEAIWKVTPIQWDGLENLREKFWLWWSELVEATAREKGEEHITFIVNLLWQIWKDRNEINFNRKGRGPGVVTNKASWGIVARDWKGKPVATWACPSFTCSVPILEEALAIKTAMVKVALEGWERIIIESDCKVVIDKTKKDTDDVVISTVLQDIKLLKHNFEECCFSFVRREFNSVSHKLARFALNLGFVADSKACFPVWLLDSAQADIEE